MKYNVLLLTTIGVFAFLSFFLPVHASGGEVTVTIDSTITLQTNSAARVTTAIVLNNDNPAKLIGGYDYSIPFESFSDVAVSVNNTSVQFTNSNNDFNQISVDFGTTVVGYKESATIEVSYTVANLVNETYSQFFELYIPMVRFDEFVKSNNTKIIVPDEFPSLAYQGASNIQVVDNTISFNSQSPGYFIWADTFSIGLLHQVSFLEESLFEIPVQDNQIVYFNQDLQAKNAVSELGEKRYLLFDESNAETIQTNVIKSNNLFKIKNTTDYTSYIPQQGVYGNLTDIYRKIDSFINEKIIVPTSQSSFQGFGAELPNREKLSQLDACIYVVGLAQQNGFAGDIVYGYEISQLIPESIPVNPTIWCVIESEDERFLIDPQLLNNNQFVLDTKSSVNRITYGVWQPDNSALGLLSSDPLITVFEEAEEYTSNGIESNLQVTEKVIGGESFEAELLISNNTGEVLTVSSVSIGETNISFANDSVPVVLPWNSKTVRVSNIKLGAPWEQSQKQLQVRLYNDENLLSESTVFITIHRDNLFMSLAITPIVLVPFLFLLRYGRFKLHLLSISFLKNNKNIKKLRY